MKLKKEREKDGNMVKEAFGRSAICRAKQTLQPMQSNVIVQTENGSELRAIWECCRFVDFDLALPIEDPVDFWIDERLPNCPRPSTWP